MDQPMMLKGNENKANPRQHGKGGQKKEGKMLDGRTGVSWVQITAADRAGWRDSVEALCATWHDVNR